MDGFELNKIAATILIAGIVAMVAGNLADILYQPEKSFSRGYKIDVAEDASNQNLKTHTEAPLDIALLMSQADAAKGKADIKKCAVCHTFENGEANRVGPNLWNVVGAAKASKKGFVYSKSLSEKGGNWSYEDLVKFIYKPRKFAPGTKMAFAGYKDPQDAANIVAFLRSLSS